MKDTFNLFSQATVDKRNGINVSIFPDVLKNMKAYMQKIRFSLVVNY